MCKVDWCNEEDGKLGYCNRHYLQIRRHGKILPIAKIVLLLKNLNFMVMIAILFFIIKKGRK